MPTAPLVANCANFPELNYNNSLDRRNQALMFAVDVEDERIVCHG